jgi:hypothetical protein
VVEPHVVYEVAEGELALGAADVIGIHFVQVRRRVSTMMYFRRL